MKKKFNKFGFIVGRANLKHTNNIMLACSNDNGLTWKFFSRNHFGSLQRARDAMNRYMSEHVQQNKSNNF